MPRRNRVDPWGDLHAVEPRGLFTGNRGCVVDDRQEVIRHHATARWITCLTEFRGWRVELARPRRWTPLFFLDDAVALAAGHRPCATCRRDQHIAYRDAVGRARSAGAAPSAAELDRWLGAERLGPGRGLVRAPDRCTWQARWASLPDGAVVVAEDGTPSLVHGGLVAGFSFEGWCAPRSRPHRGEATVLTPPTSVDALSAGYVPVLHPSVAEL